MTMYPINQQAVYANGQTIVGAQPGFYLDAKEGDKAELRSTTSATLDANGTRYHWTFVLIFAGHQDRTLWCFGRN